MKVCGPVFVVLVASLPAGGDEIRWDNDGGVNTSWHLDANWEGDQLPQSTDTAVLEAGTATPVSLSSTSVTLAGITCRILLEIDETLTVSGTGLFDNCIRPSGGGFLTINGSTEFIGTNQVTSTTLQGPGLLTNSGLMQVGSRSVTVKTNNFGVTQITTASVIALNDFNNFETLDMGTNGRVTSGVVTNAGKIVVPNVVGSAELNADLMMSSGEVSVPLLGQLRLQGGTQSYTGGVIKADGILTLASATTPVNHEFDGMASISGIGFVLQRTPFVVRQSLGISQTGTGKYETDDLLLESGVVLTNSGNMEIATGTVFSGAGSVKNTGMVDSRGNPLIGVAASNENQWTAESMRLAEPVFENLGTLAFTSGSGKVSRTGAIVGGIENRSGGKITYDSNSTVQRRMVIAAPFLQESGASLEALDGVIELEDGPILAGHFISAANSEIRLFAPVSSTPTGGMDLMYVEGDGLFQIGQPGGQADLEIDDGDLLGNTTGNIHQRNGDISFGNQAKIANVSNYRWSTGRIVHRATASGGQFLNMFSPGLTTAGVGKVLIDGGGRKDLGVKFFNFGEVTQNADFTVLDESSPIGPGRIVVRSGHWEIQQGTIGGRTQSTKVPADVTFLNESLLKKTQLSGSTSMPPSATIDVDLLNEGEVLAEAGLLNLNHPLNQAPDGSLFGGTWTVLVGGALVFPTPPTALRNGAIWSGGGSGTIETVGGDLPGEKPSRLEFNSDETRTLRLVAKPNGEVVVAEGTTLTLDSASLASLDVEGGEVSGKGTIKGPVFVTAGTVGPDLKVRRGRLSPGRSPGELLIEGVLTMADAVYEWEVSGPAAGQSDLLTIINGTANLGGTVEPLLLDGYLPPPGTMFTILTAPTISGTFDGIDLGRVGGGVGFSVVYSANSVVLTAGQVTYASYDDWKLANFSGAELLDLDLSGPDADYDGDGLTNFQEYVHALRAKSPDPSPLEIVAVDANYVDLCFPWADGMSDAAYSTRLSETLQGFSPVGHSVVSSVSDGAVSQVTVRVPLPAPRPAAAFAVLEVTELP